MYAVVSVVFFGFFFGPLALVHAQRSRFQLAGSPHIGGGEAAEAATRIGKASTALHLTIALALVPMLLMLMRG